MKKIHPAWAVCAACAILLFCNMGLTVNSFSIYMSYLISLGHYSNTQVSALTTIRSLTGLVATFITSWYYRKLHMRRGMFLSGCFVVASFFVYGFAGNYIACCLAAALAGIGYGLGTMVPVGIMLDRWFSSNKGTATGICTCMTGFSTVGIPSLVASNIEHHGLSQTFLIEGTIILAAVIFCLFLLKESPETAGVKPYGFGNDSAKAGSKAAPDSDSQSEPANQFKSAGQHEPAEQFKSADQPGSGSSAKKYRLPFYALIAAAAYTSAGYGHLSVLITSEGHSAQTAALIIMGSGLAVIASKFLFGRLSETIGTYRCNLLFGGCSFIGLLMVCLFHANILLLGTGVVLYSAGLGLTTVGIIVWASELSAPGEFEKHNHLYQSEYAVGALAFSFVPGFLADCFGGSYIPSFILFAACAAVVTLSAAHCYRKSGLV